MKTININVTENDIRQGVPEDCNQCPIAIAALRVFPETEIRVGDMIEVYPLNGDDEEWYDLPDSALEFISDFDDGKDVHPFSFEAVTD